MDEYIVTVKAEVSIMADSRSEADNSALEYCMGLMSFGEVEVLDIHEVHESAGGPEADRPA